MTVFIDFETRSDLDLGTVGAWIYSLHPSTKVLCMAYKINEEKTKLWIDGNPWPKELNYYIDNLEPFEAHNVFFEYCIWNNVQVKKLNWPPKKTSWKCSAARAAYFGIPAKLEKAAKEVGLIEQKDMDGHRIMLQLCKPRKPSKSNPDKYFEKSKYPEKFKKLYKYCIQDVETEYALSKYLPELPRKEQRYWQLDQEINLRGIPIDINLVNAAIAATEILEKKSNKKLIELTNNEIQTTNQVKKITEWIRDHGYNIENLQKETVEETLKQDDVPEPVRAILEIKKYSPKASLKKFPKIAAQYDEKNGTIKNQIRYHGAEQTGRWAGQEAQPQNLARGFIKSPRGINLAIDCVKKNELEILELLFGNSVNAITSIQRSCIKAPPGKLLMCADFAGVEARGVAWISNCEWAIKNFEQKIDPYRYLASIIFNVPIDSVDKSQRFVGKQAVLGLGYGMGWQKFLSQCAKYGQEISENLAKKTVGIFRDNYWAITQFWNECEVHAKRAILDKTTVVTASPNRDTPIVWEYDRQYDVLNCRLPSRRIIRYHHPKIEMKTTPWGEEKPTITYMGIDSQKKVWERKKTFGGKLTENIIQAVCRDLLAYSMLNINKKYPVIMTIHDEIVSLVDKEKVDILDYYKIMCKKPKWAKGFPVDVDGWFGKRYRKQ